VKSIERITDLRISLHKWSWGACGRKDIFQAVDLSPKLRVWFFFSVQYHCSRWDLGLDGWLLWSVLAIPLTLQWRSSRSETCLLKGFWSSDCLGRWRVAPWSDKGLWWVENFSQALATVNIHWLTVAYSKVVDGNENEKELFTLSNLYYCK